MLGHPMVNIPTKLEVPSFTRYGDTKVVENAQNWGILGWLGVTQVIGNVTIR